MYNSKYIIYFLFVNCLFKTISATISTLSYGEFNVLHQLSETASYSLSIDFTYHSKIILECDFYEASSEDESRYLVQISRKYEPYHTKSSSRIYLKNDVWNSEAWAVNHTKFSMEIDAYDYENENGGKIYDGPTDIYIKVNDFGSTSHNYPFKAFYYKIKPVLITNANVHCPNMCNGHGTCVNSSCICDDFHIGIDCNIPATMLHISNDPNTDNSIMSSHNIGPGGHIFFKTPIIYNWSILSIDVKVDRATSEFQAEMDLYLVRSQTIGKLIPFKDVYD